MERGELLATKISIFITGNTVQCSQDRAGKTAQQVRVLATQAWRPKFKSQNPQGTNFTELSSDSVPLHMLLPLNNTYVCTQ